MQGTKVPQMGARRESLSLSLGRDHLFFSSFHSLLHWETSFLHFNSWDWRVISHTDQEGHFCFLNVTLHRTEQPHNSFAFQRLMFTPSPRWWQSLGIAFCWLFRKDGRQKRKRSLMFSFLYIQGLNSITNTYLPVRKRQNSLGLLLNWLNLAAFLQSYTWNTTDECQEGFKRSQKDRQSY